MFRIIKWSIITVLTLALALAAFLFWYSGASQPQLSGTLQLSGLKAPVDVVRDAQGVPHIFAASGDDAYFALGFVHAQDRLWQMEMNRRIAAGRVAEILGQSALDTDRFLRTLGIRRNAEAIYANLSNKSRASLDAYAKGVNAYLASRKTPLPPEFMLTGAPSPAPWHPVDSISWQTMMAWDLGANWTQELLRMRLSQRLPLARINEFLAPYPGERALKTQDYTKLYRELSGTTQQLAALEKIAPPSLVEGMGSNNWVVAGERTTTGKPLLANDPHLGLSAPALWYFAHLSAPDLDVIGATLPGIPGVVLGHNERIAWGFTNTAPDVQDLYIEKLNPANSSQYKTPEGWATFRERIETIKVKGAPDVRMQVRESRHGPVITGALPLLEKTALDAKRHVIAFAWTALRPDDLTIQAGMTLARARDWNEFVDSMRDFGAPQQNMVYADVDGNIGFIAPARVPIRKAANDLKGLAPAPGWDARYDWDGFIPFDRLPRQFNPAGQKFVTANQKVVDEDYPFFLTSEWTLPFRAERIAALLDAKPRHDLDSFAAIQGDHVSLAARQLFPYVLGTVARSPRAAEALRLLSAWDGSMAADRAEPLIFNAWMREVARGIFADELGPELMQDYFEQRNVHQAMVNVLQDVGGQSRWCADVSKPAGTPPQTCSAVLAASLDVALADLAQRHGADMAKWRWGDAHQARSEHRPFGKVRLLSNLFDLRIATPGDTYTVNVGRYSMRDEKEPFVNKHAASLRALYDLSDLENSRFIHSTGQSGNVFSPLYRNFSQRWADVGYVPMQMRRASVEKRQMGTLVLTP